MLGAVAEEQDLDRGGAQAEQKRAVAGHDVDQEREQAQQELIVVGDPLPRLRPGGPSGMAFPVALSVGATIAAGPPCARACQVCSCSRDAARPLRPAG